MNHFESINVSGFRRLHSVELPLKPLNVVIGANGSGKTSLLEVFSLLASSAVGGLANAISYMGGITGNLSNFNAAARPGVAEFKLKRSVSEQNALEYHITLFPNGVSTSIGDERLQQDRGQSNPFCHIICSPGNVVYFDPFQREFIRPTWKHNPTESALSQVPKMFPDPEEFRRQLASSTHYHVLDVRWAAPIRMPQPLRNATLPGKDGENLVSCLYSIRET